MSNRGESRRGEDDARPDPGLRVPHSVQAEESVIFNVVQSAAECLPDVLAILPDADAFYLDDHAAIYRTVLAMYARGEAIDLVTVCEQLDREGRRRLAAVDGPLLDICSRGGFPWNAAEHAAIVRGKAITRGAMLAAEAIIREGYAGLKTAEEIVAGAIAGLQGIARAHAGPGSVTVKDKLPEVLDRWERRRGGEMLGLPTGLEELDVFTDGFQRQEMVVLGARPSMGKTAFGLQICDHIATDWGKSSLFVSLEMNELALTERVLIARARLDGNKIRTGAQLTDAEMGRVSAAYEELRGSGGPIHILMRPSRNILQIAAEVRALKARAGIEFLVVDYVQVIDSDDPRETEVQALTRISKLLKGLARELDIPVLVLSQLSRNLEGREDKTPRMSDLRGSGTLEQDADIILLLHRPEYYVDGDRPGLAQVIVAKNRSGRTGSIDATFVKEMMRFENRSPFAAGGGTAEF